MLDIGAGPGTSWAAASEIWENLKATLLERDRDFVEIGSTNNPHRPCSMDDRRCLQTALF